MNRGRTKIDLGLPPGVYDIRDTFTNDYLSASSLFIVLYPDGSERGFATEAEARACWASWERLQRKLEVLK